MAKAIRVKPNQSALDVAIQDTGSMEAAMAFCMANSLPISHMPAAGDTLVSVGAGAGDNGVVNYLNKNNIVLGTANLGLCPVPTIDEIAHIESASAYVTFTPSTDGSGVEWSVLPAGDPAPVSGTLTTESELALTGLTADTDYKFWLRTKCLGNFSAWVSAEFTTAEDLSLSAAIVLKPVLTPQVSTSVGYSFFLLRDNINSIRVYTSASTFLATNTLKMQTVSGYLLDYGAGATTITSPLTNMTIGVAQFTGVGAPMPGEYRLFWSNWVDDVVATMTFKDVNENIGIAAPMVVVNDSWAIVSHINGELAMETVSATETEVVVRLTASNPPIAFAGIVPMYNEWKQIVSGSIASPLTLSDDPADPLNPNVKLFTLAAGTHCIGIATGYTNEDGEEAGEIWPPTLKMMTIEVS